MTEEEPGYGPTRPKTWLPPFDTSYAVEFTVDDRHAWKWVALALHSAMQGACVCHLVTTAAPVGAVTEQNAKEWLKYFDVSRDDPESRPPQTRLLSLPDLLTVVRKPQSAGDMSNQSGVRLTRLAAQVS